MKVQDIVQKKGSQVRRRDSQVITINEHASVAAAVSKLVEHNIGALMVLDDTDRIAGIITERDILREYVELNGKLIDKSVSSAMTKDLIIAAPSDDIEYVQGLMTDHHIRHLPIMTNKELVGILSIRDIMKAQNEQFKYENKSLKNYITRTYPD